MFIVGDRVRCTGFKDEGSMLQVFFITVGDTGTVVGLEPSTDSLEVKWDNPVCTECEGTWWVDANDCEPEATH